MRFRTSLVLITCALAFFLIGCGVGFSKTKSRLTNSTHAPVHSVQGYVNQGYGCLPVYAEDYNCACWKPQPFGKRRHHFALAKGNCDPR